MAYGSDEELTTWLNVMGLSLPQGTTAEGARTLGTMLLDGMYGSRFSGQVATAEQLEEWPRINAYRGTLLLPPELIPQPVIYASYFIGQYAANNPGVFFTGGAMSELVKREKIGPIDTEYAVSTNWTPEQLTAALLPVLPFVDSMLSGFLIDPNAKSAWILSVGG